MEGACPSTDLCAYLGMQLILRQGVTASVVPKMEWKKGGPTSNSELTDHHALSVQF